MCFRVLRGYRSVSGGLRYVFRGIKGIPKVRQASKGPRGISGGIKLKFTNIKKLRFQWLQRVIIGVSGTFQEKSFRGCRGFLGVRGVSRAKGNSVVPWAFPGNVQLKVKNAFLGVSRDCYSRFK